MRVIRIVRTPAIEAALARFDAWWAVRSPRERVMLGVLAALLGGVILIYGVIKPLQAARAQAIADIRTYETLNARIRAAGTLSAAPKQRQRTGTPIEAVAASATSFGLVATPEPIPGGVRAAVADGSYDAVMAWIADIGATTRLRVQRVSIQRRPAAGRVSATVDFGA
jgi:general secretion pathway protein M